MLTDVQKRKISHLFSVMDSDGNGHLEWADYERIAGNMAATRGWEPGSEKYEELMGRYRQGWEQSAPFLQNDGMNLEQFQAMSDHLMGMPGAYDLVVRSAAETIFDTFDVDEDGRVSIDEWKLFFRAYGIDEAHADTCFPKYDVNGDGYVSRQELVDIVAQFYMSSDPDAPGNWLFGPF